MPTSSSSLWIALFTAIGTGTIVGAFVGRWGAISTLRQNWIDELRNDLAAYFTEIDAMHFESLTTNRLESEKKANLLYRRILLRLNMKEELHIQLAEILVELFIIGGTTTDSGRTNNAVTVARQILKQEWEVVKYGPFTKVVAQLKRSYNDLLLPN